MRDNYVGDIGDFTKYGLLRAICMSDNPDRTPSLSLGVVWYLFPDKESNNDGQHLHHYKKPEQYRSCDPELYDCLEKLIQENDRCVTAIRQRQILPPETIFFEEPLSFQGLPKGTSIAIKNRLEHRAKWVVQASQAVESCDIVFVDPDNGLEVDSVKRHLDSSPKYTYFDELLPYIQREQSLVIYQHKNRHGTVPEQIERRIAQLRKALSYRGEIHTAYFSASGGRIFFILPNQKHSSLISMRLKACATSEWGKHFVYHSTAYTNE